MSRDSEAHCEKVRKLRNERMSKRLYSAGNIAGPGSRIVQLPERDSPENYCPRRSSGRVEKCRPGRNPH